MIYRLQYDRSQPLPVSLFPPIPEHSLYFYPRDPLVVHALETGATFTCKPSVIVGPQVKRVNLSLGYNHIVIRVGFLTGGLHRLLRLPLHEIVDYTCNTEDFFGNAVAQVNEQLNDTEDLLGMKEIVEKFLIGYLYKTKPAESLDAALSLLMKEGGKLPIEYIAKEACLSMRQFERKCKDRVGLSPKLFARIIRFSKAYRMREAHSNLSWTSIAHTAGYFDQMHMIRDFKMFAGVAPTFIDKELAQTPSLLQADLQL